MQKIKSVQIYQRSFTMKELPVRAVWDLLNNEQDSQGGGMVQQAKRLLALACPELTDEVLLDLYPSEIEELWLAFEEVNAAFLGVARRFGLDQVVIEAVTALSRTLTAAVRASIEQSVSSSPMATDLACGTTATASS